jgi:urease beta subunit
MSDVIEIRKMIDIFNWEAFDEIVKIARGECTGSHLGRTCIEIGSSDCVAFCNRCLAKEAVQTMCKRLDVVPSSTAQRFLERTKHITRILNIQKDDPDKISPENFPWKGWT